MSNGFITAINIGIIDADLIGRKKHRFPNLACMKLSSFYKQNGNEVNLLLNFDSAKDFDKVFISKVFTDTPIPDDILSLDTVEYGGTGFFYDKAPPLSSEVEHIKPDYHLYDEYIKQKISEAVSLCNGDDDAVEAVIKRKSKEFAYYTDYSIGFMTRGCIRQCSFCVNKNYKKCSLHSPLSEFLDEDRPYICVLDDNVLSCKDWRSVFEELQASGKRFQFKQGMDERLLTDEKCEVIFNKSKWIGDYIFAFDNIKDAKVIEDKLKLIRKHTNRTPKFYIFCGFNHEDPDHYTDEFWTKDIEDAFKRIEILMKYKCLPYVMRYKDYELSPYRGTYINLARWCNQPSFFKKKMYREFCEANGKDSACHRYATEFETHNPNIAQKYYDLKY